MREVHSVRTVMSVGQPDHGQASEEVAAEKDGGAWTMAGAAQLQREVDGARQTSE